MKKIRLFESIASSVFLIGVLSSCNPTSTTTPFVPEKIVFEEILCAQQARNISAHSSYSYIVNQDLFDQNYLQLLVKTKANVKGKFIYHNNDKPSQKVEEEFFIEGSDEQIDFRQFLDAFRPFNTKTNKEVSVGNFDKTLDSIEITNINDETINFELCQVNISDREIPEDDKEIYIESDTLKVGMDLLTGGTLTYLERTDYDGMTVDEIVDKDNNVQIGVGYSERAKTEISSHVNLINIYDAGRQIQQSYYASIGGYGTTEEDKKLKENGDGGTQNGYTRNLSKTADSNGYYWPYNPVQGGDEKVNFSQIIDYRKSENELYCKVRALDWAGAKSGGYGNPDNNRVTKSYMENWFTIKNGMLYAKNRFIDWNGFTDLEDIPGHNIEMPATYISHPLHVYQCYNGDKPFAEDLDETLGKNQLDRQTGIGSWKNGGYKSSAHTEDWFAWTNDENFGVGVYIPGATYYSSGRSLTSTKIDAKTGDGLSLNCGAYESPMAGEYNYNKPEAQSDYQSCYVRNTSYTAPVKAVKLKNYIPLEYTYVVAVDYVRIFRESFKEIHDSGEITNEGLKNWEDK